MRILNVTSMAEYANFQGVLYILARRKKKTLPDISGILSSLSEDCHVRFFKLTDIPEAVTWAERGFIAIHENYHSLRRQSYHVICGNRDNLVNFCKIMGIPEDYICASEFYRFWHLTWFPNLDARKAA